VNAGPTISAQPSSSAVTYCRNSTSTALTVAASGTGTITYQWYSNSSNSNSGGSSISGQTSSSYFPQTTTANTRYYYCIVSIGSCSVTSTQSGAITVVNNPNISSNPSTSAQTICINATTTALSITATAGSGSISGYQWYSNSTNSNSGGTLISGATSSSYTPPTTSIGTTYYYCVVTNSNTCSTTSNVSGLITVNTGPTISAQPSTSSTNYCLNATAASLSITASNATSYQWYSNTTNSNSGGTLIASATSSSYTPSTSAAGTTYYYCIATNSCSSVTSSASGGITVFNNPSTPTLTPSSVCEGSTATFTASGGTIFEFTKNGVSQGSPDTTRTKIFTSISASDVICVKSYSPSIDGSLTSSEWGTALATSSGGATSGFGNNRMDALYLKNDNTYLYGAIAGNLTDDAQGNKILLFIDSKSGGYNTISSWSNKGISGFYSTQNLNNCITFDAGFFPDYILVINRGDGSITGDVYFDLINMQTGTKTYLGSANSSKYLNFQANSGTGDYTKGFEFVFPLSSIGSPSGSFKVFAMIVNNPGTSGANTFLSNQFLGKANSGESNYGNGCVDFNAAPPNPISYSLSSASCYTQTCATINPLPTVAAITGTTSVCMGSTTTLSNTTNGGVWSSIVTGVATINSSGVVTPVSAGTTTVKYVVTNGSGCKDSVSTTFTVNALPTVATITGTTSVCMGSTTTLSDATSGGVWSSTVTGVATINSSGVVTPVSAGTTTV
ncbi:MAG: hypothetical protein NTZ59_11345, partial [Bacteroidetes bacterium]|nr:hypothetical protein [Bacteroidota bacterium]